STYENDQGRGIQARDEIIPPIPFDCHICVLLRWTNPTQETFYPTSSSYPQRFGIFSLGGWILAGWTLICPELGETGRAIHATLLSAPATHNFCEPARFRHGRCPATRRLQPVGKPVRFPERNSVRSGSGRPAKHQPSGAAAACSTAARP